MFYVENLIYIGIWFFLLVIYYMGYYIDLSIPKDFERKVQISHFKKTV